VKLGCQKVKYLSMKSMMKPHLGSRSQQGDLEAVMSNLLATYDNKTRRVQMKHVSITANKKGKVMVKITLE